MIDPATHMGPVALSVADADRSIRYYQEVLGLQQNAPGRLGTAERDLLVLEEEPGAVPSRGHTGLFHVAFLLPDRTDLGRWLRYVAERRIPLTGLSDHLVSEAIYLRDPDGHGIEVYADRPRDTWRRENGELVIDTLPLDTDDLLGAADGAWDGAPVDTVVGHVHLQVADVPAAEAFYRDVIGFDVIAHLGPDMTVVSAGGYHHHVAVNSWAGRGLPPAPPGTAALRHLTIVLPSADERDAVVDRVADSGQEPTAREGGVLIRDPSQNAVLLTTA